MFYRIVFYILLFIVSYLLITACSESDRTETEAPAETRELDYTSSVSFSEPGEDAVSSIRAAVADDDHTRSEGLMNVHELPEDTGMLFIFEENEPRSFWMANTPLSLDIIFANEDFEIVRIHRNTPPYSHESFQSEEPAKYVVEVNAGYTMRHDIREGMVIRIEE